MKIFSWMQSKFNAKQEAKKPISSVAATNYKHQEPPKEEFSDWPQALLAIGTFGNNNLEQVPKKCENEEEDEIDRGQASTLQKQVSDKEVAAQNLPLEDERSDKDESIELQDTGTAIVSREKDGSLENKRKGFGKKSMSLLVKKMFVCSSGIVSPTSGLRDPIPDKSRMEKMLRAILHKKIYPQNSSSSKNSNGKKKYLDTNHIEDSDSEEDDDSSDGCKWVKTDSEYIVLEI